MSGNLNNGDGLVEATIGLLINALGGDISKAEPESLRGAQLVRVHAYINQHIEDPDLTPAKIADACRISVRYLHWLFEPTGTSVLKHVIQQRLMLCRRELANPMMVGRTITEIAFSSGFLSSTHFARRFKAEYGITPQEFRHDVFKETGEGSADIFPFATDAREVPGDEAPAWR
jgi:AraC-like DNA-binding protein